jgi:sugar lactone lactonase YvrE
MSKKAVLTVILAGLLPAVAAAVVPQKWELRAKEDFLRGKLEGLSVSSEGLLTLAPREEKLAAPVEEFYLSLLVGPDGVAYLGTGHGGKVYRVGRDGQAELLFQAPEMDVTCLELDKKGVLYAGTSPNGKIYKISDKGKAEEFFNPAERYIWDLLFTDSGRLWAAVGESGGIYEVSPEGEGRQIFKAEDNHILRLVKTQRGDVIAGSGGKGLVYRVSPEGKASVVFETPYEEVRSLAIDAEGLIYAAASGTPAAKSGQDASDTTPVRLGTDVTITVSASGQEKAEQRPAAPAPVQPASAREAGAVYRISPDGVGRTLWSSTEEMVYSLALRGEDGAIIFGTGPKGRVYAVDKQGRPSLLLQTGSEQAYELLSLPDRKLRLVGNNPCYLGDILPAQRSGGEFLSPALDAKTISAWGRITWEAELPAGATLQLQTRSGNTAEPNSTWSDWSPFYQKKDEQVLSPRARFLQVKAVFKAQSGQASPALGSLAVFYVQTNLPPAISKLEVLKPNEVFLKMPEQEEVILGLEDNADDRSAAKAGGDELRIMIFPKKAERQGFQTITWEASDDNGDELAYSVFIKEDKEKSWRLLQKGFKGTIFAFESATLPDGTYSVKVAASDASSNPAGMELTAERVSRPFVIDSSQPVIRNVSVRRSGSGLEVEFEVEDAYSRVEEVRYLVRPAGWRVAFPVDGVADSRSERFKFSVKLDPGSDDMITIRARDGHGNVGVYRQAF